MNISDRPVGSGSRECIEQFHEAHLVSITHGGRSTWLDPFGTLHPEVVVNLLPELGVRVDLLKHGIGLWKEGSAVSRGALMLGVIFLSPLLRTRGLTSLFR